MLLLTNCFHYLFADISTTIISLIICFIVYKLAKFYVKVYNLPPGPIPLPILGNVLTFRGTKEQWSVELEKLADKYGPIFTFWVGNKPNVMISDIDIGREAFHKNEFAGRPDFLFGKVVSTPEFTDIVFADYGHRWEALRRVAHSAAQKYSTTDKLNYMCSDCVDSTVKTIIDNEGIDKPFVPFDYIYQLFHNILAASAFSQKYSMDNNEYKQLKYIMRDFWAENTFRMFLWEALPIMRYIDGKGLNLMNIKTKEFMEVIKIKFQSHYKDYSESIVRDFCDTLISAKNDALREGKESAPYLTDENLAMVIFDLFLAGTDSTQATFRWILLFLSYYPNMQKKLRQEIETEIGDRIPTHEDRNRCHHVMAFISETLRLRNVVPIGFGRKTIVKCTIDKYTLPKGTDVSVLQSKIHHNEQHWTNADQFIPERFLENGKYLTTRPKAFIPFGVGRRVCLGEKLAITDMFLVLVRFLQSTSDYDIVLHSHDGIEPIPNIFDGVYPNEYKLLLKKIQ